MESIAPRKNEYWSKTSVNKVETKRIANKKLILLGVQGIFPNFSPKYLNITISYIEIFSTMENKSLNE